MGEIQATLSQETILRAMAGGGLAYLISLYGTPVAARAAVEFNIVDKPDGNLKQHRGPIPYMGGLAIYVAFLIGLAMVFEFDRRVLGILLAGTIVVLLGLIVISCVILRKVPEKR